MSYEEHHKALVAYLLARVELADWHAVSDAANDLRVLEAELVWKRELAKDRERAKNAKFGEM